MMNGDDPKFDNLQSFLQSQKVQVNSRTGDIKQTIKKAESDHSFRRVISFEHPPSLSRISSQNLRASYAESVLRGSNIFKNDSFISTTLSPASFLVDSLGEIDTDREGRAQRKDSNNHHNLELSTIKEGLKSRRPSNFRNFHQVSSPSNKTDPGFFNDLSFLSENDSLLNMSAISSRTTNRSRSPTIIKRTGERNQDKSAKSKKTHNRESKVDQEQENPNEFYMIQPLYTSIETDKDSSPLWRNRKSLLNLEEDIFPNNIISYARTLDPTSFSSYIKELITYVSKNRNKNTEFFASRPKAEASYSILFKEKERAVFEKLLTELCAKLKEEPISLGQKYSAEINYFEAKLTKLTTKSKTAFRLEEKEFLLMNEKIIYLMNEPCFLVSHSVLEYTYNYIQHLLKKFDSPLKVQPLSSSSLPIIEYITLPRLLEKVIMKYEQSTFFRDVLIYTYDLYISPINLLLYFTFKFFVPQPINMSRSELQAFQDNIGKTKSAILSTLTFWLEERSLDFIRTPSLLTILSTFLEIVQASEKGSTFTNAVQNLWELYKDTTQRLIGIDPSLKDSIDFSSSLIVAKGLSSPMKEKKRRSRKNIYQNKVLGFTSFSLEKDISLTYNLSQFCEESADAIAQQLTLIDWKLFSRIELGEIINKRWTKGDKKECPHYWRSVSYFNAFSSWIQYTILSQESDKKRAELVEKFLQIAKICIETYQNFSSSNSIFSALLAISKFAVVTFEGEQKEDFDKLAGLFAPSGSSIKVYNEICRDIKPPSVPNLNLFLKIFLKLQEGVTFTTNLPESQLKYLKFQYLVQIHDYCKQLKKFQKEGYENIQKNRALHQFLKSGFKGTTPIDLENAEEVNSKIAELVQPFKVPQTKLKKFFGIKNLQN